jgi:hypothetical protein
MLWTRDATRAKSMKLNVYFRRYKDHIFCQVRGPVAFLSIPNNKGAKFLP